MHENGLAVSVVSNKAQYLTPNETKSGPFKARVVYIFSNNRNMIPVQRSTDAFWTTWRNIQVKCKNCKLVCFDNNCKHVDIYGLLILSVTILMVKLKHLFMTYLS